MRYEYSLRRCPLCIGQPHLDKSQGGLTRAGPIRLIEEKGIESIGFHYTALDGKSKNFSRRLAELVLTEGERVDGYSLFNFLESEEIEH